MLQAQWEADPGAWLRGEAVVDGTPDALAADNRVFFSLGPVIEGKVALLAQSSYLRLALSPEVMRGQWAMRAIEPASLTAELAQSQDADVLCIESNYLQSGEARKLLWRYLTNGRGVILLVNRMTPGIAGFLRELGFESEGEVQSGQGGSEKFQYVFLNHPIFHPFLSPDFGNLLDIRISKYFRLKTSQALPLIFSEKGAPLFFQAAKQKLFVLAFGLDREHTSWPVHQTFIPFLDLCLQTARAEDPTPINFEPGEVTQAQMPGGVSAQEVVLRDANGGVVARLATEQGKTQIRVPARPGLYSMTYDDSSHVEKLFSVNPPPKESELDYVESPDTLRLWQVERPIGAEKSRVLTRAQGSRTGILQQRLWWWMLVGGLAVLMLEMAVVAAGRRSYLRA